MEFEGIILDTDIIIGILNGERVASIVYTEALKRGQLVATTSVSVLELAMIAQMSSEPIVKMRGLQDLIDAIDILPVTKGAALLASEILSKDSGVLLRDALVAGVALEEGFALLTKETGTFGKIAGLRMLSVEMK
jgi:predicted nucleic acid-binding protein